MLLLTSTSDILRVVTGTTGSNIQVHASWLDNAAGTITPGRTNTAAITTNTTTTIVGSPAASTQRNIRGVYITNTHATVATQVTVQHYDGTTSADLMGVNLLPGENLVFSEEGEWHHHDSQGADYWPTSQLIYPYIATGHKAESIPRNQAGVNVATAGTGVMMLQAIWLPAGMVISNLITHSGSTASATQTNRWLALYDSALNLLRQQTTLGTTVIAANTLWTGAITSYTTTYSGLYYVAAMTQATTVNSLIGVTAAANLSIRNQTPKLTGTAGSALTTTAPATTTLTATANSYWVAVS